MRIVELNEMDQLPTYRGEWTRLLSETRDAAFFQTSEWLSVWWKHFGIGQTLRTLLVYEGDRLVGIVPLVVKSMATRAGAVRVLTFPLDDWGTRFGPIGSNAALLYTEALRHILSTERDWDVVDFNWISTMQADCVRAAFEEHDVRPQVFSRADMSLIDLTQSWGEYWKSRTTKHRNNVRRAEKKLAKCGEVNFTHYQAKVGDDPEACWPLYEMCEQVAEASWQGESATGTTLNHEEVKGFLREAFKVAVQAGAAVIYALKVDEHPVAFSYNFATGGTEFGLRMGYDPAFKAGAPGTVLLHRMLKAAFESGQHSFDLGEGDSDYKHLWRTQAVPCFRFCHYAKTSLRAQALRIKRHWSGCGSRL